MRWGGYWWWSIRGEMKVYGLFRREKRPAENGKSMKSEAMKEYDFSRGKRGAIEPTPLGKTRITIRLDNEILVWFRKQVHLEGGGNYQTLINNALLEYVSRHEQPI